MFDFKNEIENELYKKEFLEFAKRFLITRNEFENIFESAKIENEKEYYDSPAIKKIVLEIKGTKINDFSTHNEIEKYLLEIFVDKTNALEIKQRFYEKF